MKGIVGSIYMIFSFIVVAAIFIVILRQFDGDIVAAFTWVIDYLIKLTLRLADYFSSLTFIKDAFTQ